MFQSPSLLYGGLGAKVKTMKIKKKYIEPVLAAINYPISKFVYARKRDKMKKALVAEYETLLAESKAIKEKFANKKDGQAIIIENSYDIPEKKLETAKKELEILFEEEVTIEEKDFTFGELKDIVEKSTAEFLPGQTEILSDLFDGEPKKKK